MAPSLRRFFRVLELARGRRIALLPESTVPFPTDWPKHVHAVLERFFRTFKAEGTRRLLLPLRLNALQGFLDDFALWYNFHRPHSAHGGLTPGEFRADALPLIDRPRLETRERYPIDESNVTRISKAEAVVFPFRGRATLPAVTIRAA